LKQKRPRKKGPDTGNASEWGAEKQNPYRGLTKSFNEKRVEYNPRGKQLNPWGKDLKSTVFKKDHPKNPSLSQQRNFEAGV